MDSGKVEQEARIKEKKWLEMRCPPGQATMTPRAPRAEGQGQAG